MHGRIPLIGCLLGLLVSTNGSYFFNRFTVPFVYNEVRTPSTEDLVSFENALKLVNEGTLVTTEGCKILSFFKKVDFVRLSYKAYYRTKKGKVCFVKWRLWATGMTSVVASICDQDNSTEAVEESTSEEEKEEIEVTTAGGSKREEKKVEIEATTASAGRAARGNRLEVKTVRGLSLPAVQLVGSRNTKRKGSEIFYIVNSNVAIHENGAVKWVAKPNEDDKFKEGNENGMEHVTPSTNLNLFSASLGDEIDPVHTTREHKGRRLLNLVKQDGDDGNYLVPKKEDMNGFLGVAMEKPLLFSGRYIPNDIDEHKENLEFVNSGEDVFLGSGKRVSFNDDDRNTDLSQQDGVALDDAPDGSNVYGRPSGDATPGRRRKKVKMFLANRAWKTNNFDNSYTEAYGEGWNRRSRYGQRSGRDNQTVRPVFIRVNRNISPKIHRIVKEPIKMKRRSKKY